MVLEAGNIECRVYNIGEYLEKDSFWYSVGILGVVLRRFQG